MPCQRHRYLMLPLYYYGHVLPPPIVKMILKYAYEMTVFQDTQTLHLKLEEMLNFLHGHKDDVYEHMRAYKILDRQGCEGADRMREETRKLLHAATVNLATAVAPPNPRFRHRQHTYVIHAPAPLQNNQHQGFVLPEMRNYM